MVNQRVQVKLAEAGKHQQSSTGKNGTESGKKNKGNNHDLRGGTEIIKSPSDTTIYASALRQGKRMENALDQISNFVEGIKISAGNNSRNAPNINAEFLHSGESSVDRQQSGIRRSLEEDLNRVEEEDQCRIAKDSRENCTGS